MRSTNTYLPGLGAASRFFQASPVLSLNFFSKMGIAAINVKPSMDLLAPRSPTRPQRVHTTQFSFRSMRSWRAGHGSACRWREPCVLTDLYPVELVAVHRGVRLVQSRVVNDLTVLIDVDLVPGPINEALVGLDDWGFAFGNLSRVLSRAALFLCLVVNVCCSICA